MQLSAFERLNKKRFCMSVKTVVFGFRLALASLAGYWQQYSRQESKFTEAGIL